MWPKPVLFISAVSKELRSARDVVGNTLLSRGYDTDSEDIFNLEQGDIREMLRRRIDAADGVIQIIGQCHGCELPQPDPDFGRVSYTQYEALYARQRGKKVWYLLLDDSFPADPHDPEPEALRQLQAAYRQRVLGGTHLYHCIKNDTELENCVLRLPEEFAELRRQFQEHADRQDAKLNDILSIVQKLSKSDAAAPTHDDKLLGAFARLPEVLGQMPHDPHDQAGEARLGAAYARLENEQQLLPGTLKRQLPVLTNWLLRHKDLDPLVRAHALFIQREYGNAEQTALQAARQLVAKAIEAFELAGSAAREQIQYARALGHYHAAAALTSQQLDPVEWARVQHSLAIVLLDQGDSRQAANILPAVVTVRNKMLGPENPDTLKSRNNLANAMLAQGNHHAAELEHCAILAIRQRVLGPGHLDTLKSHHNLANVLFAKGSYAAAEASRRVVLAIMRRVQGPEHVDTLNCQSNLANALFALGRYAEAEVEHRAALATKDRMLTLDHPDITMSCHNLALCLKAQNKKPDALVFAKRALAGWQKTLGDDNPHTKSAKKQVDILEKAQCGAGSSRCGVGLVIGAPNSSSASTFP